MGIINKVSGLKSKQDEIIAFLADIPYSKVDDYMEKNIKTMKDAKIFLKKLTKLVLYIIKENV